MKRVINIKKFAILSLFTGAFFFSSCIKDYRDGETNFSNLQPTVSIVEGGLAQFSTESLIYPATDSADTAIFRVNYAATNVAPANESVSLAIDTTLVAAYNAANGLTGITAFQVMPDSLYSYNTTQATVATGQSYSPAVPFTIFPYKINPSISYMLPIKITGAPSGATISANYGTIYYHVIGNPIAGTYNNCEWIRWNAADTAGAPTYDFPYDGAVFSPLSATEIAVQSAENGAIYDLSFTNTAGVLSDFSVALDPSSYSIFGLATLVSGPTIEIADPINGLYRFTYSYINTSGAARTVVEIFAK